MSAPKPKLFVGSSSEAKEIALHFCNALKDVTIAVLWDSAPEFEPTTSTLAGIFEACDEYDFGLFILTPDDQIVSRGEKGACARDNIILELGCFLGRLGANRTFAVIQETPKNERNKKIKVISDLDGIHIPRFSFADKHEMRASINNAILKIRDKILEEGRIRTQYRFHKRWGRDPAGKKCWMLISCLPIKEHKKRLVGKQLILIARKRDPSSNLMDDKNIVKGTARMLSEHDTDDFKLSAKFEEEIPDTEWADICLLLIPESVNISKVKTIAEMIELGCDIQAIVGCRVPSQKSES